MREIEHWNQFSTRIKGYNYVLIWPNLSIYNPKPLLLITNSYTKFEDNQQKMSLIEHGNQFSSQIKDNNCANLTKCIHLQSQTTPLQYQLTYKAWRQSAKYARNRALKPIFFANQGQWLCAYLTKFIHQQSQTTPTKYQLIYKVWRQQAEKWVQ